MNLHTKERLNVEKSKTKMVNYILSLFNSDVNTAHKLLDW